jgi:hypothetical protein
MSRLRGTALLALGLLGLLMVLIVEKVQCHRFIYEGEPRFSWICSAHTFLIAFFVLCILLALKPRAVSPQPGGEGKPGFLVRWGAAAVLFFGMGIVALFLLCPRLFGEWAKEDSLFEWATAGFLFVAGAVFAGAAFRASNRGVFRWTAFFLAGTMWLGAMEEISWFQRVLKYPTPAIFADNSQSEVNLHNFATNEFDSMYYTGTFFLLVVLVFLKKSFSRLPGFRYVEPFVANPLIATAATLPNAFNYGLWNSLITQGPFFACLAILSQRGLEERGWEKKKAFGIALLMVLAQFVFLAGGPKALCVREYKEFLIAMLWWVYALDVSARIAPLERRT